MRSPTTRPRSIPGLVALLVRTRLARRTAHPARACVLVGAAVGALAMGVALRHAPPARTASRLAAASHAFATHCDRAGALCLDARACRTPACVGVLHAGDLSVGPASGAGIMPSVVSNGAGWGVAWSDFRDGDGQVYFARVGRDGRKVGAEARVTQGSDTKVFAQLAWSGRGYAVAWTSIDDNEAIHARVARITGEGRPDGAAITLPGERSADLLPMVAWSGRAWGVAWYALREQADGLDVRFAGFDAQGRAVDAARVVRRDVLATGMMGMAWAGERFGLAWSRLDAATEQGGIGVLRLRADGAEADEVMLAQGRSLTGNAVVAPAGDALAMAWQHGMYEPDGRNSLAFATVASGGIDVRPRPIVERGSMIDHPSIAWNGGAYGVAWHAANDAGNGSEVFFVRVGRDGAVAGAPVRLSNGSGAAGMPSLAWDGEAWGVAWHEMRDAGVDVWFARVDRAGRVDGREVRLSAAP